MNRDGKLSSFDQTEFILAVQTAISCNKFAFDSIAIKRQDEGVSLRYSDYLKSNTKKHLIGLLGEIILRVDMSFSIIAAELDAKRLHIGKEQCLLRLFGGCLE